MPGCRQLQIENLEYEVERIVGRRVIGGRIQYRVHWANYSSSDDTWEPLANFNENSVHMVRQFEANRVQRLKRKLSAQASTTDAQQCSSSSVCKQKQVIIKHQKKPKNKKKRRHTYRVNSGSSSSSSHNDDENDKDYSAAYDAAAASRVKKKKEKHPMRAAQSSSNQQQQAAAAVVKANSSNGGDHSTTNTNAQQQQLPKKKKKKQSVPQQQKKLNRLPLANAAGNAIATAAGATTAAVLQHAHGDGGGVKNVAGNRIHYNWALAKPTAEQLNAHAAVASAIQQTE